MFLNGTDVNIGSSLGCSDHALVGFISLSYIGQAKSQNSES